MTAPLPTFWYVVAEHDPSLENRYEAKRPSWGNLAEDFDATIMAEKAADDYHSEHDGWEATWPLTFVLFDTENGPERARRSVDREAVPHFTARKIK